MSDGVTGCLKLQVSFRKRATNHRALWWEIGNRSHISPRCSTLQRNTAHGSALQHSAAHCTTHCNTLQRATPRCSTCDDESYHTAAHCSTLQHTAAHCNTLQHAAAHVTRRHIQHSEYRLFYRALLQKRPYFFKEPTGGSHPIGNGRH